MNGLLDWVGISQGDNEHDASPTCEETTVVYSIPEKGSKLKKMVSDVLARNNPFEEADAETTSKWEKVLAEYPQLSLDIHKAAGKKWNGTQPWSPEHRQSYMVETNNLYVHWEQQILKRHTRKQIELAADGGCIASSRELEHLDRMGEVRMAEIKAGWGIISACLMMSHSWRRLGRGAGLHVEKRIGAMFGTEALYFLVMGCGVSWPWVMRTTTGLRCLRLICITRGSS